MKFYLVRFLGENVDCYTDKEKAIKRAKKIKDRGVIIYEMDIPVTKESICRIISDFHGFNTKIKTVYSWIRKDI
jgi:hypothetical protein